MKQIHKVFVSLVVTIAVFFSTSSYAADSNQINLLLPAMRGVMKELYSTRINPEGVPVDEEDVEKADGKLDIIPVKNAEGKVVGASWTTSSFKFVYGYSSKKFGIMDVDSGKWILEPMVLKSAVPSEITPAFMYPSIRIPKGLGDFRYPVEIHMAIYQGELIYWELCTSGSANPSLMAYRSWNNGEAQRSGSVSIVEGFRSAPALTGRALTDETFELTKTRYTPPDLSATIKMIDENLEKINQEKNSNPPQPNTSAPNKYEEDDEEFDEPGIEYAEEGNSVKLEYTQDKSSGLILPVMPEDLLDIGDDDRVDFSYAKDGSWEFCFPIRGLLRYDAGLKSMGYTEWTMDDSAYTVAELIIEYAAWDDVRKMVVMRAKGSSYDYDNGIKITYYPSGKVASIAIFENPGLDSEYLDWKGCVLVAVFSESGKIKWIRMDGTKLAG